MRKIKHLLAHGGHRSIQAENAVSFYDGWNCCPGSSELPNLHALLHNLDHFEYYYIFTTKTVPSDVNTPKAFKT
jgi:hypothetical protein